MEEKNDFDKVDDVMLPGFRFHPTDEELVGFYLKRKVQQQPLPIEIIKQVDIYKYDPWDLPKIATTGEKEWYFYCPRDRKYRNSARPNRVTGAGFWKATGTDRPIYSSDGAKCVGLKKSLVFYRGRAAKGFKTDWMMHEFRLPSSSASHSLPPKRPLDKSFPANDSWAVCRIFKKTSSMAQRALSHSYMSPLPEIAASEMFSHDLPRTEYRSENISCTGLQQQYSSCTANFSGQSLSPYAKSALFPFSDGDVPSGFLFSPSEVAEAAKSAFDGGSGHSAVDFDGSSNTHFSSFSMSMPHGEESNVERNSGTSQADNSRWGPIQTVGFPFNLPGNEPDLPWDSPPCPSDMSTSFSTNKCYN